MPKKNGTPRACGAVGRVVRPAINGKTKIIRTAGHRWSDKAEEIFLTHLASTCNVTASAAEAGFSTVAIYNRRAKEPGFAARWQVALEQGYARLEMQLVECASSSLAGEALPGEAPIPPMTATEAMNLLKLHRAAVCGGRPQRYGANRKLPDIEQVRADVLRRVKAMEGGGGSQQKERKKRGG